ncbi:acyclic terpene utilization AtuA family protein [Cumulibacter manganitolerans]|uniref:acyclic terpene utilization AtuA family protein n=1 Tax=Cumulibacter manganitolerans TaxID=1884992 RepID=UPI0012978237|nr:acyclic terpene utilization AtuA family protein [Cumulibacter manganitolerans]
MGAPADRPIRIGSFSGYLGDRFTGLAESVTGDPVDVVIGDYLAEFTLAQLAAVRKAGQPGYVEFFVEQVRPNLADIAERGIRVVTNAGGFDPAALAAELRRMCAEDGHDLTVAHIEGDNVLEKVAGLTAAGARFQNLDSGRPLSEWGHEPVAANAYLGGWGIARALAEGADIVICGRVTDASLICGSAAWWHSWAIDDWDRLARAVVAGHIIECGAHATGGNFAGFRAIPSMIEPGFPIAEIAADGTTVITKHERDAGAVVPDTVTAQLLYELQGVRYLNPDVTVHLDDVRLSKVGKDRVQIDGVVGSPPPETTKVAMFAPVGYKITNTVYATSPDVAGKVELMRAQVGHGKPAGIQLDVTPLGVAAEDPQNQWEATVAVRFMAVAKTRQELEEFDLARRLGALYLQSIPGFFNDALTPFNKKPSPQIDYWPALLPMADVEHVVVHADGRREAIEVPPVEREPAGQPVHPEPHQPSYDGDTVTVELGRLVYARAGDKGGNSNVGVWSRDPEVWPWLRSALSTDELRRLIPDAKDLDIVRHEMEGIQAVHFVLRGLLGTGGSSNTRVDQIGKAIGEYLRSRHVVVPADVGRRQVLEVTAADVEG